MNAVLQDIRYALRQLRSHPGFALTAILSLALGIGATVSVFSVIYAVLMDPYPYAETGRMAHLTVKDKDGNYQYVGLTGTQVVALEKLHSIQSVAAWDEWDLILTGHDVPENVRALYMARNSFATFGAAPLLGRNLGPADSPFGQEPFPVVMLSHHFWLRHYNGDTSVIGRTLELVHKKYTIVGVTQPRFAWGDADVYLPLKLSGDSVVDFNTTVRLKPGVSFAMAEQEVQPLLQQFAKETPRRFPKTFKAALRGLNDQFLRDLGGTLYLLFGAVALLLAIGCGNVSILLLARGTVREHEFAIRSAIGASRSRIVRQLLTESLLLALAGAGLGILFAFRALALIVAWLPQYSFPHEADIHINLTVLLFSIALGLLTSVFFGLFPALQLARPEINQVMQSGTRKVAGSIRGKRTHSILFAGQIALTLLLLTAAGAAIEGFLRVLRVPLGYDPHHVISIGIPIHDNTFKTHPERVTYYQQLLSRIAALPDVESVGISTNATPPASGWDQNFELFGKPFLEDQKTLVSFVDSGYFSTLKIPLLEGRLWNTTELTHGAPLAVVNESFVKRYYSGADVLGHSLKIPRIKNEPPYTLAAPGGDGWLQIVGVVRDSLDDGLDKPIRPQIYLPYSIFMWMHTQLLVRTHPDPRLLVHNIQQQIAAVNPDQQMMGQSDDLETWIKNEPEWARGRLVSVLFAAFSVLALVLASVGLYSVVTYSVAQRMNEFGIRMALGAQGKDVLEIVLASAGASVGLGIAAGLALSFGLNRVISAWAENGSHSPWLALAFSFLLVAVAACACLVPARKASSVDPMMALRCE